MCEGWFTVDLRPVVGGDILCVCVHVLRPVAGGDILCVYVLRPGCWCGLLSCVCALTVMTSSVSYCTLITLVLGKG